VILLRDTRRIIPFFLAILVPALGCSSRGEAPAKDGAPRPGGEASGAPLDVASTGSGDADAVEELRIVNIDRYPGLTADHRRRLARDRMFVVPTAARALFQLYERNERLELPSYVTPDLAVDVFLAVVAAVQQDVEQSFAAPPLYRALHALVRRGIELRRYSTGDGRDELAALDRVIADLAVGAHLLGAEGANPEPADEGAGPTGEEDEAHPEAGRVPLIVPLEELPWPVLPPAADAMFQEAVSRVRAADGVYATAALQREVDFRVFGATEGVASARSRALVRALIWLQLAGPAMAGDLADNLTGPLLARLLADAVDGDEPVAVLWRQVAARLDWSGRVRLGTDVLGAVDALRRSVGEGKALPPSAGASIRAVLALSEPPPRGTLGLLPGAIDPRRCSDCDEAAGWAGPAAAGHVHELVAAAIEAGPSVPVTSADFALEALERSRREWILRVASRRPLQPAAGLAADCVPAGNAEVRGAVAPARSLFFAIAGSLQGMAQGLQGLGVLPQTEIEDPEGRVEEVAYRIQELLGSAERFARLLGGIAEAEQAGATWTREQTGAVARIGGWAESVLADAAQATAVEPPDPRWAAREPAGTVGGVGGVDAIYVVIETPDGPLLARGAAYAVFMDLAWPFAPDAFADSAWRDWLDSPQAPPRPAWLAPFVAVPFPPPSPVGEGTRTCLGPDSAGDLEL